MHRNLSLSESLVILVRSHLPREVVFPHIWNKDLDVFGSHYLVHHSTQQENTCVHLQFFLIKYQSYREVDDDAIS